MNHKITNSANAAVKRIAILLILIAYVATSGVVSLLPASSRLLRMLRVRNTSFFSKLALAVLGVHVRRQHRDGFQSGTGGRLVISNHVSYIDILVISSLLPSVFITSVELKNTPLLGFLARAGGSLFVERRSRSGLKREIDEIARVLRQGFAVVLFPEGTTSNGDGVCQFKNSLFDSAMSSGADILPLCLRYTTINGEPLSAANRDSLFYYGGVPFSRHFPRFLSLQSVKVEVTLLKKIKPAPGATRKQLGALTHAAISAAYREQSV